MSNIINDNLSEDLFQETQERPQRRSQRILSRQLKTTGTQDKITPDQKQDLKTNSPNFNQTEVCREQTPDFTYMLSDFTSEGLIELAVESKSPPPPDVPLDLSKVKNEIADFSTIVQKYSKDQLTAFEKGDAKKTEQHAVDQTVALVLMDDISRRLEVSAEKLCNDVENKLHDSISKIGEPITGQQNNAVQHMPMQMTQAQQKAEKFAIIADNMIIDSTQIKSDQKTGQSEIIEQNAPLQLTHAILKPASKPNSKQSETVVEKMPLALTQVFQCELQNPAVTNGQLSVSYKQFKKTDSKQQTAEVGMDLEPSQNVAKSEEVKFISGVPNTNKRQTKRKSQTVSSKAPQSKKLASNAGAQFGTSDNAEISAIQISQLSQQRRKRKQPMKPTPPSGTANTRSHSRPTAASRKTKAQAPVFEYIPPKILRYYNSRPTVPDYVSSTFPPEYCTNLHESLLPPVYPSHFTKQIPLLPTVPNTIARPLPIQNEYANSYKQQSINEPISLLTPENSEVITIESSNEMDIENPPSVQPDASPLSLCNFFDNDEINDIFDLEKPLFELTELQVLVLAAVLKINGDDLFLKLSDIVKADNETLRNLLKANRK